MKRMEILLLLIALTGCSISPGSNSNTTTWSYSSVSGVICPVGSYSITPSSIATNLLLNHFGPEIKSNHTQTIYYFLGATNSLINKEDISILYACEQTPIIFNNKYLDVVDEHSSVDNTYIAIMNVDGTNNIIAIIGP